ncbi:MAG: hypothetical protein OHK0023_10010 [Anaerolineae bacterium]
MAEETFLYLTTIGHRSGHPHTIEIWYIAHEDCYYVVAEGRERAHWVKNIQKNPRVRMSVGTQTDREQERPETSAFARSLSPVEDSHLIAAVSALMQAKYNWSDGLIVQLMPESTTG